MDFTLTESEFTAWDIYAESHPHLVNNGGYRLTLEMFLAHFRRGINLNDPLRA